MVFKVRAVCFHTALIVFVALLDIKPSIAAIALLWSYE